MIDLRQAVFIHSEMQRILNDGKSSFLTTSINHTSHKISKIIEDLNSESVLFCKDNFNCKDFIDSLEVDGKEVIYYKKKETNNYNYYNYCYSSYFIDIEKIIELASPAPFGKGSETIYDENIRKAFEIKADRIKISQKIDFNNRFKELLPRGKKFNFKLYKMQIYQKGGKFKRHKDTVHASNHYATLVVSVPTEFKGGKLILYENKGDEEPLTEYKYNYNEGSILFLTDVEHEVTEVESGTRIVLQYDVYLEDEEEQKKEDKIKENEDSDDVEEYDRDRDNCYYENNNKKYLSSRDYIEKININSDKLLIEEIDAFLNKYPEDELCFMLSREYPVAISIDCLKASDLRLYEILSKNYLIDIGYVVNNFESNYDGEIDIDDRKTLKVMNYTNKQNFLQKINDTENKYKDDKENKINFRSRTHLFISSGKFVSTKYSQYVEYTGNEAAPAEYTYVSFALNIKRKN
jgi:hypothetical protein